MNCVKISFSPKKVIDDETMSFPFWDYLAALYHNGQILKDYTLIENNDNYFAYVTIPDNDALDDANNSQYVSKYLTELKGAFEFSTDIVGENVNTGEPCNCIEKPEWYLLHTDYADEESPVKCGRCGNSVPLYSLPKIRVEGTDGQFEDDYYSITSWQSEYKYVDKLWMACLSDRFTFRQMNNINSRLSKAGRYICKELEELTSIPFYYYLFKNEKTLDACPSCAQDWKMTKAKTVVTYLCDKCRLATGNVWNAQDTYDERKLIDLLKGNDIDIIRLTRREYELYRQEWFTRVIPEDKRNKAKRAHCISSSCGYLWHAFSYKLIDCLEGDEAKKAFDSVSKKEAILLDNWNYSAYKIKNIQNIASADIDVGTDVIITDHDFNWTYTKTHEEECGPYFHYIHIGKRIL